MYSSRRIIVLRPSIVSNQPNDHLMIVQRKKQMDTQIKEHLVRTSVQHRIYRWFWEPGVKTQSKQLKSYMF